METVYFDLQELTSAKLVLHNWHGMTESVLAKLISERELPALRKLKVLNVPPENYETEYGKLAVCEKITNINKNIDEVDSEFTYCWDGIVFEDHELERIENMYPHLAYSLAENEQLPESKSVDPESEWICCETLAMRWGCSPFNVLELLVNGGLRYVRRQFPHSAVMHLNDLPDAYIHAVDLRNLEVKKNTSQGDLLDEYGYTVYEMVGEYKSLVAKVKALEAQNTALHTELESERARTRPELTTSPKTAAACEAADAKRVEHWKANAALMVQIAFECTKEGPKKRKRPQLVALAKKCGGKLPDVALNILRKSLPDEHVSSDPGPQKQD